MNVDDAYAAGRRAWPNVQLPLDTFREFVEQGRISTAETYLACACAAGIPSALEAFESTYLAEIDAAAARLRKLVPSRDDARQIVRERLFTGTSPKIREYRGQGALGGWLRVVALRALLNARLTVREDPFGDDRTIESLIVSDGNPELDHMRQRYAREFREVLLSCVRSLEAKDRLFLRLAFVEGLTVEAIGELYGVHKATASRWVRRAHGQLTEHVRSTLLAGLQVSESELDSIVRLVGSAFDTRLSRYLRSEA